MLMTALTMMLSPLVPPNSLDKGWGDFQDVDRKLAQIAQAGITCTKIVHNELYAHDGSAIFSNRHKAFRQGYTPFRMRPTQQCFYPGNPTTFEIDLELVAK